MSNSLIMVLSFVFLGILFIEIDNQEKEDRRVVRVCEDVEVVPFVIDNRSLDGWFEDWEEEDLVIDYKEYYREAFRKEFKRRRIEWENSLREERPQPTEHKDKLFSF